MKILKYIVFIAVLGWAYMGSVNAQCVETPTDPCVTVNQSILDRTAKALKELEASRETIAAFLNERAANQVERLAWQNVSKATDAAINAYKQGIADRDKIIELWEKAFNSAMQLADHYHKQLTKGKSGFQKVMDAIKTIGYILAGAALGRGL